MADPKLKEAMAEINAIMKKHDIGGHITLVSPTNSEFRYMIDPSWSCAWFERADGGAYAVRFRANKESIPDKQERHKIVENTMHLLLQIRDLAAKTFVETDAVVSQLGNHVEIEHKPFSNFEPHEEH